MPTAFGMILEMTPDEMFEAIGHDGSEIIDDSPEPHCRKGFHPQECVHVAVENLVYPVLYEMNPSLHLGRTRRIYETDKEIITDLLSKKPAVLFGIIEKRSHAVAWWDGMCNDPDGGRYPIERFQVEAAFIMF